jgi:hypothetical protein
MIKFNIKLILFGWVIFIISISILVSLLRSASTTTSSDLSATPSKDSVIPKPDRAGTLESRLKTSWKNLDSRDNLDGYSYCEAKTPKQETYKALDSDKYELNSIYLMTRHGARTPENFLPPGFEKEPWLCASDTQSIDIEGFPHLHMVKDYGLNCNPEKEACYAHPLRSLGWTGNCSQGQLTPMGMVQLFNLGKELNKIYSDKLKFIPSEWNEANKVIQVRSTDYWRTFQSAQSLITGYFNQSLSNINATLDKLVIHSVDRKLETLLINEASCPNLKAGDNVQIKSELYQTLLTNADPIYESFTNVLGDAFLKDNPLYLEKIVDVFQSRSCHQKSKICNPKTSKCIEEDWVNLAMAYANTELRTFFRELNSKNLNLPIVRAGGFLIEIKRNLLAKAAKLLNSDKIINKDHEHFKGMESNLEKIKWFYYSAHDTSISPILGALNSIDMKWPPYRSNVLIELWKPKGSSPKELSDLQVQFIYNGSPLKMKWCESGTCNLKEFLNYLDNELGLVLGWELYLDLSKFKKVDFVNLCWGDDNELLK